MRRSCELQTSKWASRGRPITARQRIITIDSSRMQMRIRVCLRYIRINWWLRRTEWQWCASHIMISAEQKSTIRLVTIVNSLRMTSARPLKANLTQLLMEKTCVRVISCLVRMPVSTKKLFNRPEILTLSWPTGATLKWIARLVPQKRTFKSRTMA